MSRSGHQPTRMCIGCRARHPQDQLLRFRRRSDGVVEFCPSPRPGEGRPFGKTAYLCPLRGCYNQALKRRAFTRALGASGPSNLCRRGGLSVRVESTTLWTSILNGLDQTIQRLVRSGGEPHRGRLYSTMRLRDELGVRGKDA